MQKKILNKNLIYLIIFFFLVSCSSVPKHSENACKIFDEKYLWYKYSKKSSEKWGVPIEIILAVIHKESGFARFARPKRTKLFKIIPYRRPSSSFGFSQAIDKTWELYKSENEKPTALRISFKSSVDFVGWYFWKTKKINKTSLNNAYSLYLNYYLGWGNYANKTYKADRKAIIFAKSVEKQSKIYKNQLRECQKSLDKKKYIIF